MPRVKRLYKAYCVNEEELPRKIAEHLPMEAPQRQLRDLQRRIAEYESIVELKRQLKDLQEGKRALKA